MGSHDSVAGMLALEPGVGEGLGFVARLVCRDSGVTEATRRYDGMVQREQPP